MTGSCSDCGLRDLLFLFHLFLIASALLAALSNAETKMSINIFRLLNKVHAHKRVYKHVAIHT